MMSAEHKPTVEIYADDHNFDENDLEGIRAELQPYFEVKVGPYLSRSLDAPATILIVWLLNELAQVPPTILSSVLYDALKKWLSKPKHQPHPMHEFRLRTDGPDVEAVINTSSDELFRESLATLRDLARPEYGGFLFDFDTDSRSWKQQSYDD